MDIRQLRVFLAVHDAGTLTGAARRLGIAQPSVSQQVRKLEDDLGTRLLDRTVRGIRLTDSGRLLLPRARRIVEELDLVHGAIARELERGSGRLVLGAIPTVAPYVLPAAIGALRDALPELAITIREAFTEDLVAALVADEIDCALLSTPVAHDALDVRVIGAEEMLLVMPGDHPLAGASHVPWSRLAQEPTVVLHEMHCLGRQIQGFCAARGAAQSVVCRTAQLATVFELVGAGLGISIVPAMAAAGDARGGRLSFAAITDVGGYEPVLPKREIAIARRRDHPLSRAGEAFRSIVSAMVGEG